MTTPSAAEMAEAMKLAEHYVKLDELGQVPSNEYWAVKQARVLLASQEDCQRIREAYSQLCKQVDTMGYSCDGFDALSAKKPKAANDDSQAHNAA